MCKRNTRIHIYTQILYISSLIHCIHIYILFCLSYILSLLSLSCCAYIQVRACNAVPFIT